MATIDNSKPKSRNASSSQVKGSGSDRNSDIRRLGNEENLLDKTNEDSFPASDAPSQSPRSGAGRTHNEVPAGHSAGDDSETVSEAGSRKTSEMLKKSERKADITRQNEY